MTSPIGTTGSPGSASPLVVVGRLVLLALAVAAVASAFVLSRGRDRAAGSFGGAFVCPMHPEVTSSAPGECPICRMALERVSATGQDVSPALMATVKPRAQARAVRAPAWVDADGRVVAILYENQLVGLDPQAPGRFFRATAPAEGIDVRRTAAPPSRWDSSTSRVDFRRDVFQRGAPAMAPGDVGWVELAARASDLLAVPASAILVSPQGPYVLVVAPDGRSYTKRSLAIGQVLAGHAVVVSGLREGERVVVGNSFFLDAEQRLSQRAEQAGVTP